MEAGPSHKREASQPEAGPSRPKKKRKHKSDPFVQALIARRAKLDGQEDKDIEHSALDDEMLFVVDMKPSAVSSKLAFEAETADADLEPDTLVNEIEKEDAEAELPEGSASDAETAEGSIAESGEIADANGIDETGKLEEMSFDEMDESRLPSTAELELLRRLDAKVEMAATAGKRYWVEPDKGHTCTICGEAGHTRRDCSHTQCATCGTLDEHETYRCPMNITCYNCGLRGHRNVVRVVLLTAWLTHTGMPQREAGQRALRAVPGLSTYSLGLCSSVATIRPPAACSAQAEATRAQPRARMLQLRLRRALG